MSYILQNSELENFKSFFENLLKNDYPLLHNIGLHILKTKGKQLRPLLVFHTQKIFEKELNERTFLSASLIEILHTASLIHDDVVDFADTRRGFPSVKNIWGNKTAVLTGDYLLANAFLKAYSPESQALMKYMMNALKQMTVGELQQMEATSRQDMTEEMYYQIIYGKTAALFGCCCQCAADVAHQNESVIQQCYEMGTHIGMAFQIQDDLLDINLHVHSGKDFGKDWKEGKLTLPSIHYLQNSTPSEKAEFLEQVKTIPNAPEQESKEIITRLIQKLRSKGSLQFTTEKIQEHLQKAIDIAYRMNGCCSTFESFLRGQVIVDACQSL